jgi:hypothetical protein
MFYQDASGSYSHSENMLNIARGTSSHAGGARSSATGLYAFVHGELSKASGQTSTSFGVNNYT